MRIEPISYGGWQNNIALRNDHAEVVVTLDVGPRVISYRTPEGQNVFKNYDGQIGKQGEAEWKIRGGHRIWIAPEGEISRVPDNHPVKYELISNGVRIENPPVAPWGIRKTLTVQLAPDSPEVTVVHTLTNDSASPIEVASWGLSVMAPGGLEIIPMPPLGEHPRDLLPNRIIVPWPYTDLSDPRYRFGQQFITLTQTATGGLTKLGLLHREKWVAYLNGESLFVKAFDYEEGTTYPDLGCNFETYTDGEMIEIESLSPLKRLEKGESVSHTERWSLLYHPPQPSSLKEEDLALWIESITPLVPLLNRTA